MPNKNHKRQTLLRGSKDLKITFQNLFSTYLTGSVNHPQTSQREELKKCPYTAEELAEMEMSLDEWNDSKRNCFQFKNNALKQCADWDTFPGYMRNTGLGVFDSLFSGVGSGLTKNLNFTAGAGLAGLSVFTSFASNAKKIPFLSTNFSLFDYGGRLTRAPLHIFDSAFSTIGEKGSALTLPSVIAGGASLFGLGRVLTNKDGKSFKLPNTTVGGTAGRTAVHHIESMLASKATNFSASNEATGSFLATSVATLGLLAPKSVQETKLPYRTFEGLVSRGGTHFLDSLFSSIGNSFSKVLDSPLKLLFGGTALSFGLPLLSSVKKISDCKASYSKFGGRIIRSILHTPETLIYKAGNMLGNSALGLGASFGFIALTGLANFSKAGKKLFKDLKVPIGTLGGQFQRTPFDFFYSTISASAMKLSKFVPAPLLVLAGPALSFQIGEQLKNTSASYTNASGLMIRNSVHLWETMLSKAAFKTGRMLVGAREDNTSSGTVLSDGRWLTNEGQIVPTMAIGKQMNQGSKNNLIKTMLGSIGGVAFGFAASALGKELLSKNRTTSSALSTGTSSLQIKQPVSVAQKKIVQKDKVLV